MKIIDFFNNTFSSKKRKNKFPHYVDAYELNKELATLKQETKEMKEQISLQSCNISDVYMDALNYQRVYEDDSMEDIMKQIRDGIENDIYKKSCSVPLSSIFVDMDVLKNELKKLGYETFTTKSFLIIMNRKRMDGAL